MRSLPTNIVGQSVRQFACQLVCHAGSRRNARVSRAFVPAATLALLAGLAPAQQDTGAIAQPSQPESVAPVAEAMPASAPVPTSALANSTGASFVSVPAPTGMMSITPYYAFVSSSMPLRSGPAERFYSIATLQQGTLVIVDAQSQGWSRVTYPAGLSAFVRAEDVSVLGNSVTLATESRLRAASQVHGFGGSWQVLLDAPLPSGTNLTLIEPVKEGAIPVAYRVQPPASARAFVFSTALRRATDAEIASARTKDATLPDPALLVAAAAQPTLVAGPNTTNTTNSTSTTGTQRTPTAIDVPSELIGKERESAGNALPEQIVQGGAPSDRVSTAGVGQSEPATTQQTNQQTNQQSTTEATQTRGTTPEDLEPLFQRVKEQPVLEGELDELIAQYEQVQSNLPANTSERRRRAIAQRIEYLRVRSELRDTMRRQQDELAKLDQSKVQMQAQLDEWARTRYYTIVGVLQPSTVYDGGRLPQMYRIVSVGTTAPRTLGYIRKTEQLDLDRYLGQVVGVIGERSIDRSLQLNLIDAVRVDPLRTTADAPAATVAPTQPAPTTTP